MSPTFRRLLGGVTTGETIIPVVQAALWNPEFKSFDVKVRGFEVRPPDGWFHPSEHPLWPERMLYYYLTEPDKLKGEPFDPASTMAITQGNFWHSLIEQVLLEAGVWKAVEVGVEDADTGARGSMDGISDDEVGEFKCLALDAEVTMAGGWTTLAKELMVGDLVVAWSEPESCFVENRVAALGDNGVQSTVKVVTREGRSVVVTSNHPFLTQEGWAEAKDLLPGTLVKVSGTYSPSINTPLDPDEAWFLGVMVGDGGCTGHDVRLSNVDSGIINGVRAIVSRWGCDLTNVGVSQDWRICRTGQNNTPNPVKRYLMDAGLWGQGSWTKTVPGVVWSGGPESWIEFLSGYFDTDGRVAPRPYPQAIFTSVNHALLRECQEMLAYLSVRSSLVKVNSFYREKPYVSWRLLVRDKKSMNRFVEIMRLRSVKRVTLTAVANRQLVRHSPVQEGWDIVSCVVDMGEQPTIAVEVEGTHTHVTGGIVTHNTMRGARAAKIVKGSPDDPAVVESFRALVPEYYAQGQEYMRLSGYRRWRALIISLEYPFAMREVAMSFDHQYALAVRDKYMRVRQAVADQRSPQPCCAPLSKDAKVCPARLVCPNGATR